MGDLTYISSEQGGGLVHVIRIELMYEYTIYKRRIPIQELQAKEGGGLIIHHGYVLYGMCKAARLLSVRWASLATCL